jgi:hypothetical protein
LKPSAQRLNNTALQNGPGAADQYLSDDQKSRHDDEQRNADPGPTRDSGVSIWSEQASGMFLPDSRHHLRLSMTPFVANHAGLMERLFASDC